jgi:hypothetical protein
MLFILNVRIVWTYKWYRGEEFEELIEVYLAKEATKWLTCVFSRKESTFQMYWQMDTI